MLISSPDRIAGNDIIREIKVLIEDRNILNMNLMGQGYEALTIITDVDYSKGRPRFLIDYPSGDRDIINNSAGSRIFFEYSGKDKLQRVFKTVIGEVNNDDIWVWFPESIDRIQRRKHFRIPAPMGTRFHFETGGNKYECYVLNISQGGALITQESKFHEKKLFHEGGVLSKIYLNCKEEYTKTQILIKKAEIRRIEKNARDNRYNYGLKFINMDKKSKTDLGIFVYDCQREILRRRSFVVAD